jgi:hypothetical protein
MASNPPSDPGKEGLASAGELMKLTVALATGALVFGAGLVKEQLNLGIVAKFAIIFAWSCLGISAAAGIWAISAIPIMLAKSNYDLEYKDLTHPARIHQVSFMIGILALGMALAISLLRPQKPLAATGNITYLTQATYATQQRDTTPINTCCCCPCPKSRP